MSDKKCNQEGCDNLTSWCNSSNNKYSKGGYYKAKCNCCSNLLSKYGINTPERDGMLEEQNSQCLICNTTISFSAPSQEGFLGSAAVDHCHTSGNVRGILCMQCNIDLGKYETLKHKFNAFQNYINEYGGV